MAGVGRGALGQCFDQANDPHGIISVPSGEGES